MTLRQVYELISAGMACFSLYTFLIQLSTPNLRGTRWLSLAFLSGAIGAWLIAQRGLVPLFLSEPVASSLAILVNVFAYWAFAELLRLGRRPWWVLWLTAVPEVALVTWFTYAHDLVGPRIIAFNLFTALQYLLLALVLLRNGSRQTRLQRTTMAILYLVWTVINLVRAVRIDLDDPTLSLQLTSPVTSFLPIVWIFTPLLTGLGFVWLAMTVLHTDLEQQSSTDALTGLLNRRALEVAAVREIALARRKQAPLTLILLDLDRFKAIHDFYGHEVGDAVLSLTAWCLRENLRNVDFVARLGGEAFVALLPDTSESIAIEIAERLCLSLRNLSLPNLEQPVSFSASFGLTAFSTLDPTWEEMFRRADLALERAKRNSRKRVEVESITTE